VKPLVNTQVNTLRASMTALPPSVKPPYQATAGLQGLFLLFVVVLLSGRGGIISGVTSDLRGSFLGQPGSLWHVPFPFSQYIIHSC